MVHDVLQDDGVAEYECLRCGTIVVRKRHPGECPDCGATLQNRAMSLE